MGAIWDAFKAAFRDNLIQGLPSGGPHEPDKPEIRALGQIIESTIATSPIGEFNDTIAAAKAIIVNAKQQDNYPAIDFPRRPYSYIGLRRYARYHGPALRVRRDDDDAESDIVWDETTNGVNLGLLSDYLGESDGRIVRIYDQGSVGGYYEIPDGAFGSRIRVGEVRRGLLPLLIDNSDQSFTDFVSYQRTDLALDRADVSIFALIEPTGTALFSTYVSLIDAGTASTGVLIAMLNDANASATRGLASPYSDNVDGGGAYLDVLYSDTLHPPTQPCVIGLTSSGAAFTHWVDGRSESHAALTSKTCETINWGANWPIYQISGVHRHLVGVVFDAALSDDEAQAVQRALLATIDLPREPSAQIVFDGDSRLVAAVTSSDLLTYSHLIDDLYGDRVAIYNISVGGKRLQESVDHYATMAARFARRDIRSIYVCALGINDIYNDGETDGAALYARAQTLLAAARADGYITVACTLMAAWLGGAPTDRIGAVAEFNTAMRAGIGTDYDYLIDFAADEYLGPYSAHLLEAVFPDHIHPSSTAQLIMAGYTGGVLQPLLPDWTDHPAPHVVVSDERAQNTAGGTFTAGADQTRTLNTILPAAPNMVGVTLAANRFRLPGGHSWRVKWSAPAYKVGAHQSLLYDATHAAVIKRGTTAAAGTGDTTMTRSEGEAILVLKGAAECEIRHRAASTEADDGFGLAANFGVEIYTTVEITRIA